MRNPSNVKQLYCGYSATYSCLLFLAFLLITSLSAFIDRFNTDIGGTLSIVRGSRGFILFSLVMDLIL